MILVGEATEVEHVDGRLRVTFRCRTQEVFTLWQSLAIEELSLDRTVRLYANRMLNEDNTLSDDYVLLHWEDLG